MLGLLARFKSDVMENPDEMTLKNLSVGKQSNFIHIFLNIPRAVLQRKRDTKCTGSEHC
jgi:hypothetical protein